MASQRFINEVVSAGETVTTGVIPVGLADRITGSVFSTQPGTLKIRQSGDGVNWDISSEYAVSANDGKGFSEELILAYAQVDFISSGSVDTTAFRLFVRTTSSGSR